MSNSSDLPPTSSWLRRLWAGLALASAPPQPPAPAKLVPPTVGVARPPEPPAAPAPELDAPALRELAAQLATLPTRLEQQLESQHSSLQAALLERLATLEKQVSRAGREQFKATTLAESQYEQTTAALEMLRAADARHTSELELLQQQLAQTRTQHQYDVALALLPIADSLDEALRAGEQLLTTTGAPVARSWLARTLGLDTPYISRITSTHEAVQQWLVGLTYVRQRVFDLLAEAGIEPIPTANQVFDPHLHHALDLASSSATHPDGTIISELRRGYCMGSRIIRHADVVVASDACATPPGGSPTAPADVDRSNG